MRRPEKLAESLREEVTEIVGYELEDPRLLGVTVTDVRVSENLRDAKVFVVVEGAKDETEIKDALKALQHAATFVRQQVAMSMSLRHPPILNFVRDTAEENAARIGQLLGEINVDEEPEETENVADEN